MFTELIQTGSRELLAPPLKPVVGDGERGLSWEYWEPPLPSKQWRPLQLPACPQTSLPRSWRTQVSPLPSSCLKICPLWSPEVRAHAHGRGRHADVLSSHPCLLPFRRSWAGAPWLESAWNHLWRCRKNKPANPTLSVLKDSKMFALVTVKASP